MDEGSLLVYPELVQHGQLPYRDFETFYGPANPMALAAAYSIFGVTIFVERSVGLLYRTVILLAIFGLVHRAGAKIASACVLIAGCLLLSTGIAAYAWMGGVACALCALWALADFDKQWRVLTSGFLAGMALLYRLDLAPAVILAFAPFLYAMPWMTRGKFCGAVILALLPYGALVVLAGPTQLLDNLFVYPVLRANPGRKLPLWSAPPAVLRLFVVYGTAAAVNLTAGLVALRRAPGNRAARLLLATSLFAAALTPQATQRFDTFHLLMVAFLGIGLLPFSLTVLPGDAISARRLSGRVAIGTLVTALVVALGMPTLWTDMAKDYSAALHPSTVVPFLEHDGRFFPFPSPQVGMSAGRMIKELKQISKRGERLFVGPADLRRTNYCDTFIYHFFPQLRPATYFLEMNPHSANRPHSRLASDVESADWLILDTEWDYSNEPNSSVFYGSDEPNLVVQRHFALIGQYGRFVLLQHNR